MAELRLLHGNFVPPSPGPSHRTPHELVLLRTQREEWQSGSWLFQTGGEDEREPELPPPTHPVDNPPHQDPPPRPAKGPTDEPPSAPRPELPDGE